MREGSGSRVQTEVVGERPSQELCRPNSYVK